MRNPTMPIGGYDSSALRFPCGGKTGVLGFLVGQVMKATRGQANPVMVNELLRKKLG
jgi:Asp-tRNA(Asn)/Glu-tRNA(Gln) amidotransferase B subunit